MTTIYRYVDETGEPRERLYLNPNLGDFGEGKGGGGGGFGGYLPHSCWFSFNNSETIKAVNLAFCSIQ